MIDGSGCSGIDGISVDGFGYSAALAVGAAGYRFGS